MQIHTPEALDALKRHLPSSAADLLGIEEIRRDVAERLWAKEDKRRLPFITGNQLEAFAELDHEDVREWLHDLAEQGDPLISGVRLSAILALAGQEPDYAFEAASRLTLTETSEREAVSSILLQIDSDRAVPVLREWTETEDSVLVLAAIGEAVFTAGRLRDLIDWLQDPSPQLREGACMAAETLPWDDGLAEVLRERLYDDDWDVRNAANQSLDRIWHAREVDRLVDKIISEDDATRRWCRLDIALNAGSPGLNGSYRQQPWAARLFDNLPLAMQQHAFDRLKKRREKLRAELKKRNR